MALTGPWDRPGQPGIPSEENEDPYENSSSSNSGRPTPDYIKKYLDDYKKQITQAQIDAARAAMEAGKPADSFASKLLQSTLSAITPDAIEDLVKSWGDAWTDEQIRNELARSQMLNQGFTQDEIDAALGSQSNFVTSQGDTGGPNDSRDDATAPQSDETQSDEGETQTPTQTPINAEDAEEYLLGKFMDIYNNPDMDMSELFQDYMSSLERGNEILQGSEGVTNQYNQDIQGLLDTPGVNLSFGGQNIKNAAGENVSLKPLNTIRTQQGLLSDRYGADIEDLTRRAAAEQTTGAAQWDAVSQPLQDIYKTLLTSRRGVPQSNSYDPEWWESLLQVAFS